jgi:hypothetical protein
MSSGTVARRPSNALTVTSRPFLAASTFKGSLFLKANQHDKHHQFAVQACMELQGSNATCHAL